MSSGVGIRHLPKAGKPPAMDERLLVDEPSPPPRPEPRFTSFIPAPRGPVEPMAGFVGERSAMRALAASGAGWLHERGRIVSRGTVHGLNALRIVPEMVPLLDRLDREVAEAAVARERDYEERLAAHVAEGLDEDQFYEDSAVYDYTAQIAAEHPGPNLDAELARAGWISLTLRRDRGEKTVCAHGGRIETDGHERHLQALAVHLEARLSGTFRQPPPSKPDPFAGLPPENRKLMEYVVANGRVPDGFTGFSVAEEEAGGPKPGF